MAENKKSFILYADYITSIKGLTDEEAGKLMKHLFAYVNDENPILEDRLLALVFEPIKQQLKRDLKKYESTKCRKSESGRLGNIKRWNKDLYDLVISEKLTLEKAENIANDRKASQCDEHIANIAVNDNDNVNDNVTVNEREKEKKEISRAPDLSKSNLFREPVIPTKSQVWECFVQKNGSKEMALAFWNKWEGVGWYKSGSPITNFRNLVDSFITNWKKNESKVVKFEQNSSPPLKTASDYV